MGISDEEVARRKLFLEFGVEDADRLTSVNELAHAYADPVIEDFYRYMLSFEATASFFEDPDPDVLEHVRAHAEGVFPAPRRRAWSP
jgi:rsbT co-antagonist protein RsbR